MDLIKVTEENGEQLVSARELYEFLELDKSQWARWTKKNIEEIFEENQEYQRLDIVSNGNNTTEYILKLDVAKELSMLSRSEKGNTIHPRIIRKKKYSRTRRFTILTFRGCQYPFFYYSNLLYK